jgi:hypothetical protein
MIKTNSKIHKFDRITFRVFLYQNYLTAADPSTSSQPFVFCIQRVYKNVWTVDASSLERLREEQETNLSHEDT